MLVIGSYALREHARARGFSTFRPIPDLDLMCTEKEMVEFCLQRGLRAIDKLSLSHYIVRDAHTFGNVEFQIAEESPATAAYLAHPRSKSDLNLAIPGGSIPVASLAMLYSLKRSHRFLARHWEKHIKDYHFIRQLRGFEDEMPEVTKLKTEETKHTKKSPSLNKAKDEFFKDDVSNHTFEHDQIHEMMAHRERPMFEYIADSSTGTVRSSKKKFFELPELAQYQCVLEEAYVIALERGVIPMLYEGKKLADSKSALQWAMMRICTTLTSGWFREFAVENYPRIMFLANHEYVEKFLRAVDDARIKRIVK